jgi:hypothetical protein
LHIEELYNLFSSPDIIRKIKERRMRWAGHVSCMGGERKLYKFWWGSLKAKDHSEDRGVDRRRRSKWMLGHWWLGVME